MTISILPILFLTLGLTLVAIFVLSRMQPTRVGPFARLMDTLPADHNLVAFDQCIKECGHIWFFYTLLRQGGPMRLTLSLNVPCPDDPADLERLDQEIWQMNEDLKKTLPVLRCEWREMEGPLAMRLYLEFDWQTLSAAALREFQERTMEIIRRNNAESVTKLFRGSGDYDIYYSEQVGNIIERSLDMVNAFDIRKYSFKSEGLLNYNEKNEITATAEEFEELYAAAKPDIEVTGLTIGDLRQHFRDLYKDGVILEKALLYKRGRKDYMEAWYRDKEGKPANWNIEYSGDAWWVFSIENGELGDIFEMDTEEEACDIFVRYVAEGIQDACSNEE